MPAPKSSSGAYTYTESLNSRETSKSSKPASNASPVSGGARPSYRPRYTYNPNPMSNMFSQPQLGMCGPPCMSMCPGECGPPCISMSPACVTDCCAPEPTYLLPPMRGPGCGLPGGFPGGFPGDPVSCRPRRRTIPMPPRPPLIGGNGKEGGPNTDVPPRGDSVMPPPPAPPPNRNNIPPPPAPPAPPQPSMEAREGRPQPVPDLPPPPPPPELQKMPISWGASPTPPPPPAMTQPQQPMQMYMPMPMPMNPMFMGMNPWFMPLMGGNIPNQTCQISCTPQKGSKGESISDTSIKSGKKDSGKSKKSKQSPKKKARSPKRIKSPKNKSPKSKGSKKSKRNRVKQGMLELLRALDEADSSDESDTSHTSRVCMHEESSGKSRPSSTVNLPNRKSSAQTSCSMLKPTERKAHNNRSSCTVPSGECTPKVASRPSSIQQAALENVFSDNSAAAETPHSYQFELTMQETASQAPPRNSDQERLSDVAVQSDESDQAPTFQTIVPIPIPIPMSIPSSQQILPENSIESDPEEDFEPKVEKWLRTSIPEPLDPVKIEPMNKFPQKPCKPKCHKNTNHSPHTGTNLTNQPNEHCHLRKKIPHASPESNTPIIYNPHSRPRKRPHHKRHCKHGHKSIPSNHIIHKRDDSNYDIPKTKSKIQFVFPLSLENTPPSGAITTGVHKRSNSESPTKSLSKTPGNDLQSKLASFLAHSSNPSRSPNRTHPNCPNSSKRPRITVEVEEFESHTFHYFHSMTGSPPTSSACSSEGALSLAKTCALQRRSREQQQ